MVETCGAVVGAMIVLGLKYGHCEVEHMGQKDIMMQNVQNFYRNSRKNMLSVIVKGC